MISVSYLAWKGGPVCARVACLFTFSLLIGVVGVGQPFVPVEQWQATLDHDQDTAYSIDTAVGVVAVAGSWGIVIYDPDGTERARIETPNAQQAVIVGADCVVSAGERGIAAYSFDGEPSWEIGLALGCTHLASGGDCIWGLSSGRLCAFSWNGNRLPVPLYVSGGCALDALDSAVVFAEGDRVTYVVGGEVVWKRTAPFEVRDLALDSQGDVWAVGGRRIALLASTSGVPRWVREFGGVSHAIAVYPGTWGGDPLVDPLDSAVASGCVETKSGTDYLTVLWGRSGEVIWRAIHGNELGDDVAYDVSSAPSGEVVVTGTAILEPSAGNDYLTICYVPAKPVNRSSDVEESGADDRTPIPPVALFEPDRSELVSYESVGFTNDSYDPDGWVVAQAWDFADGGTSATWNAAHAYSRSGWYDVTLTVVDNDGLSDSTTRRVHVANPPPGVSYDWSVESSVEGIRADFTWSVVREQHGNYPECFSPTGATDIDDVHFRDRSQAGTGVTVVFESDAEDNGFVIEVEWDFGDGATSPVEDASHTYASGGTYVVTLTVTDDELETTTESFEVFIESIVSRAWDISGPATFVGGTDALSPRPKVWFEDDSGGGTFDVTLTVQGEAGQSNSVTKSIAISDVPPTAKFSWSYSVPSGFLPTAEELFSTEGNYAVQGPSIPSQAGAITFSDLAYDGEPWKTIAEYVWEFGDYECKTFSEVCVTEAEPMVVLLDEPDGHLFRGSRSVTLGVRDDDGEGGSSYPSSTMTHSVTVANIPPYAGFEWEQVSRQRSFPAVLGTAGGIWMTGEDGPLEVQANVTSNDSTIWATGDTTEVFVPYGSQAGAGQAEVIIYRPPSSSIGVEISAPSGWTIDYVGALPLSSDGSTVSGSFVASSHPGTASTPVICTVQCPNDGSAVEGHYTFTAVITLDDGGGTYTTTVSFDAYLCLTVDTGASVDFYAYGDLDTQVTPWTVDPNGDSVTYDWDFGSYGTGNGQAIWGRTYTLENVGSSTPVASGSGTAPSRLD